MAAKSRLSRKMALLMVAQYKDGSSEITKSAANTYKNPREGFQYPRLRCSHPSDGPMLSVRSQYSGRSTTNKRKYMKRATWAYRSSMPSERMAT